MVCASAVLAGWDQIAPQECVGSVSMDSVTTVRVCVSPDTRGQTVALESVPSHAMEMVFASKGDATAQQDTAVLLVRLRCVFTAATMDIATVWQRPVDVHQDSQDPTAASTCIRECAPTCVPIMEHVSTEFVLATKDSQAHTAPLPLGTASTTAVVMDRAEMAHVCATLGILVTTALW